MKAYRLESTRCIEPFNDHPGDCLILNRPLREHQEAALRGLDIAMVPAGQAPAHDPEEHLVFGDHLYFSAELLREFVTRSRLMGGPAVAALRPGLGTLRTVVRTQEAAVYPDRVEYDLRYVPAGRRDGPVRPVVIDPGGLRDGIPFPDHVVPGRSYDVPLTEKLLVQIDHWANLWSANVASLLAELARLKKGPRLRLLGLALRARSANQWKALGRANRIGKGCDIHHTACVEGSVIGPNVKIGAMAVVRESVVGEGAYLANHAAVELSVIGEHCALQGGAVVQYSVLYPGVLTTTSFINASMCGRDSFIAASAVGTDFRLDGKTVHVMKDGAPVDTGNIFMGMCAGHGVYLGTGCVVAPGRAIPNGLRIAPVADRVLGGFPGGQAPGGFRFIEAGQDQREMRQGR